MNTTLLMPTMDRAVTTGRVTTWHKMPGDRIAAGDALCDVTVEEVRALVKDTTADRLLRRRRSSRGPSLRDRPSRFDIRLRADEPAVLTRLHRDIGDLVRPGDLLADIAIETGTATSPLRVVADRLEPEEM